MKLGLARSSKLKLKSPNKQHKRTKVKHKMNKKYVFGISGIALAGILALIISTSSVATPALATSDDIELYKSPTCGCCGIYSKYLDGKTEMKVNVKERADLSPIKEQYGVPSSMQSCHTSIVEGYFVEGHVPTEAIEKLLLEKPDIAGIAMPGMPQGSPGMPGAKSGTWTIYAVNHDGSIEEFMKF